VRHVGSQAEAGVSHIEDQRLQLRQIPKDSGAVRIQVSVHSDLFQAGESRNGGQVTASDGNAEPFQVLQICEKIQAVDAVGPIGLGAHHDQLFQVDHSGQRLKIGVI